MNIKEITWQHRNDFYAILECEHCQGEQELKSGYSDAYYYTKVLPSITCKSCKKNQEGVIDENDHGFKSV